MPSVEVVLDGNALLQSSDPEAIVRDAALTEIRVEHGYEAGELAFVNSSSEFRESARLAARHVREEAKRGRGGKSEKIPDRDELFKATVRYPRPATRGWRERRV